jgi:hypothetical protein
MTPVAIFAKGKVQVMTLGAGPVFSVSAMFQAFPFH